MELLLPETRRLTGDDVLELYDAPGPYLRAGMLASLDGATSREGRSPPLQTPGDSVVFAALRAVADAVVVGAGTVRTEGYGPVRLSAAARSWRAERGRAVDVPLVVVSRSLAFPDDAAWLRTGRPFVLTCASAPAERRQRVARHADVLVCGEEALNLRAGVRLLAERGLTRVLCEGGPTLLGDIIRQSLLTEVCATLAPLLAGQADGMVAGSLPAPVPLELVHLLREQSTLLGRWRVTR